MSKATEFREYAAMHSRLAAESTPPQHIPHLRMEQCYLTLARNADWLNQMQLSAGKRGSLDERLPACSAAGGHST
jgi:hypothetical protein